jgi:hypothetical protein
MSNETNSESNVQLDLHSVPAIGLESQQETEEHIVNIDHAQERTDLIPCEFCYNMIPFDEYAEHQHLCMRISAAVQLPQYSVLYSENNDIYRIDITPMIQAFNAINLHTLGGSNLTQADEEENDYENPNQDENENENEDEEDNNDEADDDPDEGEYVPQRQVRHTSLIILPRLIPILDQDEQETDDEFNYRYFSLLSERLGTVKVGLSNPEAALEKIAITNETEVGNCPICQDAIVADNLVKTKCGHFYCNDCIVKWLKEHVACPVCNKDQRDLLVCNSDQNKSSIDTTSE